MDTSAEKIGISTEKNSAIGLRRENKIYRHITGHIIGTYKKQNELLHRYAAADYRRTRGPRRLKNLLAWTKERNRQLGTTAYFGSIKRDSSGSRYLVEKHDAAYVICALYIYERVKIDIV